MVNPIVDGIFDQFNWHRHHTETFDIYEKSTHTDELN
jgi:hypothetical protein